MNLPAFSPRNPVLQTFCKRSGKLTLHDPTRLDVGSGQNMPVGVHRCLNALVPHASLNHVYRDVGGKEQAGVGVS